MSTNALIRPIDAFGGRWNPAFLSTPRRNSDSTSFRISGQMYCSNIVNNNNNNCRNNDPTNSTACLIDRRYDPHHRRRTMSPRGSIPSRLIRSQHNNNNGNVKNRNSLSPADRALTTSLRRLSSGTSEGWSYSSFPSQHNSSTLMEVNEASPEVSLMGGGEGTHLEHCLATSSTNRLSLQSYADSACQPLLTSDSMSLDQLIPIQSELLSETQLNPDQTMDHNFTSSNMESTVNGANAELSNLTLPSVFSDAEAAAGYVSPQWPAALSNSTADGFDGSLNDGINGHSSVPFLDRQLWLSRNERQRRHYLRQRQRLHQPYVGRSFQEPLSEESVEGEVSWNSQLPRWPSNENDDTESNKSDIDSTHRYCPEPSESMSQSNNPPQL